MEIENISYHSLGNYNYRELQQLAKSLALPSNVKKIYLIEMIIAKKHCTQEQLNEIIERVKNERKKLQSINKRTKKKGKRVQGYEISSTSQQNAIRQSSQSPSISGTPKRSSFYLQCTPDVTITNYQPKKAIPKNLVQKPKESDRILRSCNPKTNRPNYGIIECKDTLIKIVKAENPLRTVQGNNIKTTSLIQRAMPLNLSLPKGVSKRVLSASVCLKQLDSRIVPAQKSTESNYIVIAQDPTVLQGTTCQPPAKRQRTVSGIYPLKLQTNTYYQYAPTVGFRRNDGKISKINAMIQKPRQKIQQYPQPIMVTVQDVINRKVDNIIREPQKPPAIDYRQTIDNVSNTINQQIVEHRNSSVHISTPILNSLQSCGTQTYTNVSIKDLNPNIGNNSVYYHKKIRSEQVRQKVSEREEILPRINEVFSQFNEVQYKNLTQPIYVQVSQESDRFPQYPMLVNNAENTCMLETLYNFKLQFIINQPLLQIATTSNTTCVFSTKTAPTPVAHPPPVAYNEYNNNNSYERANQYNYSLEAETRLYDYARLAEQERYKSEFTCDEALSPCSSMGTSNSQELGANVTIPEMVEDALELISQDGDYMERLGLDVKMQCILCDWAGSKIILEYHIKKAHQKEIQYKDVADWTVVLTLGRLVSHEIWLSNVIQFEDNLYVVSAKYIDDCILVMFTTLSDMATPKHGRITIYNKITGKPYIWEGEILPTPDTMPYETGFTCLKLDITSLDLLPNSANLKLINKELKSVSDNKVIIGHPSFNDVEIVFHVTVFI